MKSNRNWPEDAATVAAVIGAYRSKKTRRRILGMAAYIVGDFPLFDILRKEIEGD